jgi:DNA-binding transcriptional ArsR family regulator
MRASNFRVTKGFLLSSNLVWSYRGVYKEVLFNQNMNSDTTINIDLNDPRSVQIAEILGNKTCKNILNLIANKEMTESDIAQELKIPLNTVDYNVKKLVKAGLIESTSHFWSVRGKKMPSYKVSEKKIVISPKNLGRGIFTLPIISSLGVLFVLGRRFFSEKILTEQIASKSIEVANDGAVLMASAPTAVSSCSSAENTCGVVASSPSFFSNFAGWEWTLIGLWVGAVGFMIYSYLSERRQFKK